MRPLLALLLSAAILLGVRSYLQFAESLRGGPPVVVEETAASGTFSVEVTLTFDAQADDFSLEPVSLVLRRHGQTLLKREGLVPAGEPLVVPDVPGVVEGRNEFYFECVPRDDGSLLARAVRVRVLRDDVPVADETLWAAPGHTPRGTIVVDVPASRATTGDHDSAS